MVVDLVGDIGVDGKAALVTIGDATIEERFLAVDGRTRDESHVGFTFGCPFVELLGLGLAVSGDDEVVERETDHALHIGTEDVPECVVGVDDNRLAALDLELDDGVVDTMQ